jgi:hypothetical protein
MSTFPQITSPPQASAEVLVNRMGETLEHQAVYGLKHSTTTGLSWGYYGGRWGGFAIADDVLTLTDASANYIVVEIASGDISIDTASTDWDDDTNYVRVYKVTTVGGVVTAVEDHRAGQGGVHGGGGGGGGGGGISALTGDVTASGSGSVAATIANDAVTYAKMQNVSATARALGRKTSGAGDTEELTLSELLDFIGSAAQGDILYRGSSAWARLGAGTSGHFLKTQGAGADPVWAAASGGAGSKTYAVFTPMTSQPPASNYATLDTRNSIAVLDFDPTTEEGAFWVGVIPEGANLASGIKVSITWMATSATSGDARWGAKFERMNTDADSDSFDTATEATTTTSGTSGTPVKTTITCTNIDSITAQDAYRLWVYRDVSDAADTMSGDAELIAVEVWSAA